MNHLVQLPPLRSWPGGCSHEATRQRGLHHAAMARCTRPPRRPGSSCQGRGVGTRLCQRSRAGSTCLWAALTQRMLPLTAEGGGEAEMPAEGWAGTRLTIPVTCPASRSASAVMRAEGTGERRVPERATDAAASTAGASRRLPSGTGTCWSSPERVTPGFARGCGAAEPPPSPRGCGVLRERSCPLLRRCSGRCVTDRCSSLPYGAADGEFTSEPNGEDQLFEATARAAAPGLSFPGKTSCDPPG